MTTSSASATRIVSDADRGGYLILYNGAVYWAKNLPLAWAMSDAIEARELSR